MIFRVLGLSAAAGLAVVGVAEAQTGQSRVADIPPYQSVQTWTGFYLGAGFGGGAMVNHQSSTIPLDDGSGDVLQLNNDLGGQGVLASIYGGYDYQFLPKALVGVLVEGTWSSIQSQATASGLGANATASIQPNFGISAVIRAGMMPTPSNLLYLLAGYTGQNFRTTGTVSAGGASASFVEDDFFNGWTVGGGIESKLGNGWSAKLEYRYSGFETRNLSNLGFTASPSIQTVRAGLSYRLGAYGAADTGADTPSGGKVNWTGPYIGAAGGVIASTNHMGAFDGETSTTVDNGGQGLLGSVFAGFDYQVAQQFVVGLMGDITWSGPQSVTSLEGPGAMVSLTANSAMSWSVLGRMGFLVTPSTLLYAAGGYTGEQVNVFATTSGDAMVEGVSSTSTVVNGWTIGPGVETVIADGWSARLEYRYSQYNTTSVLGGGATLQPTNQTIRAGLSYKFGIGQ